MDPNVRRNRRSIVLDLSIVGEPSAFAQLVEGSGYRKSRFVLPSFAFEELIGDGPQWVRTLHLHAKALLPILDRVYWTREPSMVSGEEVSTGQPCPRLIDGPATNVLRTLLRQGSRSETDTYAAFSFVSEAQKVPNIRRNMEHFARLFAERIPNREPDSASVARIRRGDYCELAESMKYRALRQTILRVPNFLDWGHERQRRFLNESLTSRVAACASGVSLLFWAKRKSPSATGEREQHDFYDSTYSVFASLMAGLESLDRRGCQLELFSALKLYPSIWGEWSFKTWIEAVEEAATEPEES